MKIERTNYEGDWSEICSFCGEPQENHKKIVGEYKGVRYEHRLPCEPEKEIMRNEQRKLVKTANWLVTGIHLAKYGISKIPFLGEASLIRSIWITHRKYKPKKTKIVEQPLSPFE